MESRTHTHKISQRGQLAVELIWIVLFFLVFVSATYWIWDEGRSHTQRHQFHSQKERFR